jgi:Delta24-sterol reductase
MNAIHQQEVAQLQEQIKRFYLQKNTLKTPLALKYHSRSSYTTRTKDYKSGCPTLNCGALNRILAIDPIKQTAVVGPRVTMEALLHAALSYGLIPPILPELREMTVGGAIMGIAGESGSHKWGTFNDICLSFEILCGNGALLKVSPTEHPNIFYGIPGSYGSLGTLVSAEIKLIPAKEVVRLRYHIFSDPRQAVEALAGLARSSEPADFLDGMVFAKDHAAIIEGRLDFKDNIAGMPQFSTKPFHAEMYYQHVKGIGTSSYEEWMTHDDYFFRYYHGAFWIGGYVSHLPLLVQLIKQGYFADDVSRECFTKSEIERFHGVIEPNIFFRTLIRPFMSSDYLCKKLHKAERWVQNRFIIQDFCIPEKNAHNFLDEILNDPGVFPIWLLPIKRTKNPQIFAPHCLSEHEQETHLINFGLYGIPSYSAPIKQITKRLEQKTKTCGGRKVLYSRSYYNPKEFWDIYSHEDYEALRDKTHAKGIWHEITHKVLSE